MLLDEPGGERVRLVLPHSAISAVNWAEVVGRLRRLGVSRELVDEALASVQVAVIAADARLAIETGHLRPLTDTAGLSLGDRFCLALAQSVDATVLTADRAWTRVAAAVELEIELIR
jgi:ribonuclease VapC